MNVNFMPLFSKWYWETGYPQAKVRSHLTPPTKMNSTSIKEVSIKAEVTSHVETLGRKLRDTGFPEDLWASLVAQMVKNLPALRETWAQSLGWEDPLGKGMATHSSILAWKTSWTEEPGGLQSRGSQRVRHK